MRIISFAYAIRCNLNNGIDHLNPNDTGIDPFVFAGLLIRALWDLYVKPHIEPEANRSKPAHGEDAGANRVDEDYAANRVEEDIGAKNVGKFNLPNGSVVGRDWWALHQSANMPLFSLVFRLG
jgi:hypothetical protein